MKQILVAMYSLLLFIAYQLVGTNGQNREFLADHRAALDELIAELKGDGDDAE